MMQLKNIPHLIKLILKKLFKEEFTKSLEENNTIKIIIDDLTNIVSDAKNNKKDIDIIKENINIVNSINDIFSRDVESLKKENILLKTSFVTLAKDMSLISEALGQIFSLSSNIENVDDELINEDNFEEDHSDKKKNKKKIYH